MISIIGFIMVALILTGLIYFRISPVAVLVLVPIAAALAAGFGVEEIGTFVMDGLNSVVGVVSLFIFAILYFGIMRDAGMFDPLIRKLVAVAGNNITAVAVATVIIGIIAHLDGSGASTFLITIPALLPIYKRLNMSPLLLVLLVGTSAGIMNIMPWGGPLVRAATALEMDPTMLWRPLIPLQLIGIILLLAAAWYLGKREKKRAQASAQITEDSEEISATAEKNEAAQQLERPKLFWFNLLLTILLIVILVQGIVPSSLVFMIGLGIALPINYPKGDTQMERLKAHAPEALVMASILFAAGSFLGVISGTEMIQRMANDIIPILPEFLGPYLHIIIGIFGVPLGMVFGPDPYYFALMPIIEQIVASYDVSSTAVAHAMLIGENVGFIVSPVIPTVYLAIGLAGVDLGSHIKYTLLWVWGLSVVMLILGLILNIIGV